MERPFSERLYYLGHSAWLLVRLTTAFLFDYGDVPPRPTRSRLSDGAFGAADWMRLRAEAASSGQRRRLIIFSSHQHRDHYSRTLHRELAELPDVQVVAGLDREQQSAAFRAISNLPRTDVIYPRKTLELGDLTVHASGSTDSGVAFLIDAPDGSIYFGGDLAVWDDLPQYRDGYAAELAWLGERRDRLRVPLRLAFMPVGTSDGYQEEPLIEGLDAALRRLRPGIFAPMHGYGYEAFYDAYAEHARELFPDIATIVLKRPGDMLDLSGFPREIGTGENT